MRLALTSVPLAVLGCLAALLVACGDGNGLLSGSESGSLQEALSSAQSACASGDEGRAELAVQRFSDRVAELPSGSVDPRLVANLQQGAETLAQLANDTCTPTTETSTTTPTTVTTTTTPTTTTETTTTTTVPTTPTEPPVTPTEPPVTPTTPPDDGGDGGPGNGGGTPGGGNPPPGPEGNPGGASPGFSGGGD